MMLFVFFVKLRKSMKFDKVRHGKGPKYAVEIISRAV